MSKEYTEESKIIELVKSFEAGEIPRDEWKHYEHLVVGLFYLKTSASFSDALDTMRSGLMSHLKAIGIDLSKEMPYHETLTKFWLLAISLYICSKNECSVVELVKDLGNELTDKDLPLKYYSRELLFSDLARAEFVEPDLKKLDQIVGV